MFKKKLHQKFFWLLILLLPFQLGKHFWPNWSYVLGLKVDYFSPTFYLTDILVFLILFLWGVEIIIHYWSPRRSHGLHSVSACHHPRWRYWWIIIIFVYLFVNSFLAQNSGAAVYKFIKIAELTLLGIYIAKNNYSLSIIQYPLSLAVVYSSAIAIAQFFFQSSLGGPFWWLGERTFNVATPSIAKAIINGQLIMRPYGTFPHPNVLAGFILIALILIFFSSQNLSILKKFIHYTAIFLGVLAIVVSFSRSVWLVGLLVGGWFALIKKPRTVARQLAGLRLLRGGGILLIVFATLLLIKLPFSTDEAVSQRLQLIKAASLMIKNFPLSGVGLNNFIVRLPDYWSLVGFTYWLQPVHNIYFLIVAETGLTGLLIFLWLLILTCKRLFQNLCTMPFVLCTSLTAILLLGLNDHYWLTLQQTQLLLTIVLGLSWSKII